uniref:CMP/dCMP-type deaminase domain-containing protein n=1 Tax=Lotharella globosa TaxID=91324 RepID=A0A7S3YTN6_9EUKA
MSRCQDTPFINRKIFFAQSGNPGNNSAKATRGIMSSQEPTKKTETTGTVKAEDAKAVKKYMDVAVQEAKEGVERGEGGPFGAVVVNSKGEIVSRAHNMVLQTNDPTAHAEMTAIQKASSKLGRFDLSDCKIYTTCEPCPMCFGAIHWAKIPVCVYSASVDHAADAGFDNQNIYDAIRQTHSTDEKMCEMSQEQHEGAVDGTRDISHRP